MPSEPLLSSAEPQEFLQWWLCQVWKKRLRRNDVAIDDDFIELGGTDAMRGVMFDVVESACGHRLDAARVLPRLTVRLLADAIAKHGEPQVAAPVRHGAAPIRRSAPRDILQDQLAYIWERLLGVTNVGIYDTLDDLGGTPEHVDRMFGEVESECGERLRPEDFEGGVTVRALSDALVARVPRTRFLQIQPGTFGATPLFFLHGDLGGSGYYVRNIARGLGADRPVYVLQQHGIHGEETPTSVETMAAEHIETLRELLPEGPFYLGGHCNGATIALEMALQLAAAGRSPRSLLVVEPMLVEIPATNVELVPRLSPEARQTPRMRRAWLFSQYVTVIARYRSPQRYDGRMAVFWATGAHQGTSNEGAESKVKNMAPQAEMFSCPGNHVTALGRHGSALASLMKEYLDHDRDAAIA